MQVSLVGHLPNILRPWVNPLYTPCVCLLMLVLLDPVMLTLGLGREACTFGLYPGVLIKEVCRVQTDTETMIESLRSVQCVIGWLLVGLWIYAHWPSTSSEGYPVVTPKPRDFTVWVWLSLFGGCLPSPPSHDAKTSLAGKPQTGQFACHCHWQKPPLSPQKWAGWLFSGQEGQKVP